MANEKHLSDSVDPLSGLDGPALFLNTLRAAAAGPLPANSKDLDSINNFMKSLELKSPEKLMHEAKRVVDGGMEILESNFVNFAEKVGRCDAVSKDRDKLLERRQGLGRGLARKRGSFALRTSVSQSSLNLESALNIDQFEDPDDYFDAYERAENAKKEIQKQLGGRKENPSQIQPLNTKRGRRPGILGKKRTTFTLKPLYTSVHSENIDVWVDPQETVEHENSSERRNDLQEKLSSLQPRQNQDVVVEEVELGASAKKDSEVSDILNGSVSIPIEDLDGEGVLNLSKEQFIIKPSDTESPCVLDRPDVGCPNVSGTGEGLLNYQQTSKNMDDKLSDILNGLLSRPFEDLDGDGAMNLLKEQLKIKPLDMGSLCVPERHDVGRTSVWSAGEGSLNSQRSSRMINSVLHNVNSQSGTEHEVAQWPVNHGFSPTPPRSPFASLSLLKKRILKQNPLKDPFSPLDITACQDSRSTQSSDKVHEQVDKSKDLSIHSPLESNVDVVIIEPTISNTDAPQVVGSAGGFTDQFTDENASSQQANIHNLPLKEPDCNTVETMDFEDLNGSQLNPLPEDEAMHNADYLDSENPLVDGENLNDPSDGQQACAEQQPEIHNQLQNEGGEMSGLTINKASPQRTRPADQSKASVPEDVVMNGPSIGQRGPKESAVHQAKQQRRKREVAGKLLQKAHPMRKSLAEAGTSFETGVRRSKRIKMRPLEYWKGERFVYGRVDDSFKLLGVKYISPTKGPNNLKVKPLFSESSKLKEILELAAKH